MFPIGINLCLFPLPVTLIKFSSKNKSDIFKSTSSLTLIPHPYKSSIIARFLSPCCFDRSMLEINSSISFVDNVSGSFLEVLGDSISLSGLLVIYFSKIRNSKKLLKPEIILDCEDEFNVFETTTKI